MAVTFAIAFINMANTYFQFKQFTIHQDQCAMKVSTEACILGAWVPNTIPSRILDIGTGTGLLALMLAQRIDAKIDAVELDVAAANQARQNVSESKWKNRINVINQNVFDWAKTTNEKYDLIVSNPPFFTNNQKSEVSQKNLAKHDTSDFNKENLAMTLKKLLSEEGSAYILYPEFESGQFQNEIEKLGLFYAPTLIIRNQPNGPVFRIVSQVSKKKMPGEINQLDIRNGQGYSVKFDLLFNPYYLK